MKKLYICLFILLILVMSPINTMALSINNDVPFNILEDSVNSVKDIGDMNSQYNQAQNCNTLLGNPNVESSVAWLLQYVFNVIKVVGPLLVVILSSIDFAKVIVKSDDDEMAKARKKLITRLVLAAALFFIPTITMVLLEVFGLTSDPTCGLQ